jgi:hypothetical protein
MPNKVPLALFDMERSDFSLRSLELVLGLDRGKLALACSLLELRELGLTPRFRR